MFWIFKYFCNIKRPGKRGPVIIKIKINDLLMFRQMCNVPSADVEPVMSFETQFNGSFVPYKFHEAVVSCCSCRNRRHACPGADQH